MHFFMSFYLYYRYSNFVGQSAMLHLRKRKIQGKSNGQKHTGKQLARTWQWTHHLNSKKEEIFHLNIIENYGRMQLMR